MTMESTENAGETKFMYVSLRDLLKVVDDHPELNADGMGHFIEDIRQNRLHPDYVRHEEKRQVLRDSMSQFSACVAWLSYGYRTKHVNPRIGCSYDLKHHVEEFSKMDVSNGAFIAAALHLGFICQTKDLASPNVYINLDARSPMLRRAMERRLTRVE